MKLTISKTELANAVNLVIRATASRPSVPSLSGILITATKDGIEFFTSDLETSIKTAANGIVEEEGQVAIAGKILSNIVKSLPETAVLLETDGELLCINAGQSAFAIRTINTADFNEFPTITSDQEISLSAATLAGMVKKVSKAVSRDETRVVLTGVLLTIDGPSIKMVSTDSFRLAVIEQISEQAYDTPFEALIPGKALDEIARMTSENDTITITVSQNQVLFSFGTTALITRRLEGKFPNYQQLLPTEYTTKAIATHSELLESVRRVSLLALNNAAINLAVSAENQTLHLDAKSQELGTAEENLMVKTEGEDNTISINYSYFIDGLSVIDSEFVSIEIQDPLRPGIIRAPEENFTYLVMPVRSN